MKSNTIHFHQILILYILSGLCGISALTGQTLQIVTQEQLDNYPFGIYQPGKLIIGPEVCCSDISDLSPLQTIEGIGYQLEIKNNPHLKSLHGLEHFQFLDGNRVVKLTNNDSLTNLEGLSPYMFGPDQFQDDILFWIEDNERLENLQGLPYMHRPIFDIISNPSLTDMDGLQQFKWIQMQLHDCANLQSFHGLENIDTLWGTFYVENCPRLKNFEGLNNNRYFGLVKWELLDSLENTDGLEKVRRFNVIEIDTCPRLTALTGFDSLSTWANRLEIIKCHRLGDFPYFSDMVGVNEFNYKSCDSIETVHGFNKLRAGNIVILNGKKLKHITSLPRGVTRSSGELPIMEMYGGPALESIQDSTVTQQENWQTIWLRGCTNLIDVSGLRFLKEINSIWFSKNYKLQNIVGLDSLKKAGNITLSDSYQMKSLLSLVNLDTLVGGFGFYDTNLESLEGLEHLKYMGYGFTIWNDSTLSSLSPLEENIDFIGAAIRLERVPQLKKITGFNTLKTLGLSDTTSAVVVIKDNYSLASVTGFQSLDSLKFGDGNPNSGNIYSLHISGNPSLRSITGFDSLRYVRDYFELYNNDSLHNAQGFCHLFREGTTESEVIIEDNATGANSVTELVSYCDSVIIEAVEDLAGPTAGLVSVHPNPSGGNIVVQLQTGYGFTRLSVFDVAGREIASSGITKGQEQVEMSLPDWAKGLYFVQAIGGAGRSRPLKIIVE